MEKHRIKLLDSFRFIAILCVLLYHFTDTWARLLPYGNFYRHIFSFGYIGVYFFFMISGFVISYTLENTQSMWAFSRNRLVRLWPPMILCSLVTFGIIRLLDDQHLFRNAHEVKNFLPGLTFTNPTLWTQLTGVNFHWLNGSYWSLWVEIQFYIIASATYFLSRKHFFRNMLLIGIVIALIKYIPVDLLNHHIINSAGGVSFLEGWRHENEIFNITFFITWFLPGVVFYQLYKGFRFRRDMSISICTFAAVFCLLRDIRVFFATSANVMIPACLLMFGLFLLLICRRNYLSFLDNALFERIGIISYTIYLIHEEIGVLLINKYGHYLGSWSPLAPLIIILAVIGFAELSYRFYERKLSRMLKKN